MLLQIFGELEGNKPVHKGAHIGVAEFCLRLSFKLRLAELDGNNGAYALSYVLALEAAVAVLYELFINGILVHNSCQSSFEAVLVRTALDCVYVVCKGDHCLLIFIVILNCNLCRLVVRVCAHINNVVEDVCVFKRIEVRDKALYTALIEENLRSRLFLSVVRYGNRPHSA